MRIAIPTYHVQRWNAAMSRFMMRAPRRGGPSQFGEGLQVGGGVLQVGGGASQAQGYYAGDLWVENGIIWLPDYNIPIGATDWGSLQSFLNGLPTSGLTTPYSNAFYGAGTFNWYAVAAANPMYAGAFSQTDFPVIVVCNNPPFENFMLMANVNSISFANSFMNTVVANVSNFLPQYTFLVQPVTAQAGPVLPSSEWTFQASSPSGSGSFTASYLLFVPNAATPYSPSGGSSANALDWFTWQVATP